ncbi:unnamed protein product [Effrenium voratum]|nr:unnamed protein product [Effrenium voratum]
MIRSGDQPRTTPLAMAILATGASMDGSQDYMAFALCFVAVSIWLLERKVTGTAHLVAYFRSMQQLLPELLSLSLCLSLALALVYCGQHNGGAEIPKQDEALWSGINAEWPILKTADTLLGIQAMMRLVLLSSALLRQEEETSAFAMEPAGFLLAASLTRSLLLLLSPWEVYHLDGPLGGNLNLACELCAVPMAAYLCRSLGRRGFFCAGLALLLGCVACAQRLSLADPGQEHLDVLFSWSQLLDLAVAVSFLCRCVNLWTEAKGAFMVFSLFELPAQQLLGAIFMLCAWGAAPFQEVDGIVGAGHPLLMMQSSSLAEVTVYLVAAVVFVSSRSFQKDQPAYVPLFAEL